MRVIIHNSDHKCINKQQHHQNAIISYSDIITKNIITTNKRENISKYLRIITMMALMDSFHSLQLIYMGFVARKHPFITHNLGLDNRGRAFTIPRILQGGETKENIDYAVKCMRKACHIHSPAPNPTPEKYSSSSYTGRIERKILSFSLRR